jgi:hypothetical protein
LIPIRIGFSSEPDLATYVVDIFTEIWFLLDLCWFNMRQGYQDPTVLVLVMDLAKIQRRYLKTWFLPDLVSSIPVELIALTFVGGERSALADWSILRVVRFVKIFRLVKLLNLRAFRTLEKRQPVLARAFKLLFSFFFVIHYMACCYWWVVRTNCDKISIGNLVDHPFCPSMPGLISLSSTWEDLSRKYTFAAYWSLLTMLGGNSMEQDTTKETFFTFCMLLIGMLSFTSIIGSASALIGSIDSHDTIRKSELAFVRQDLNYLGAGPELQELVEQYLLYSWAVGQTPAHADIRARLPRHIREEIQFYRLRALVDSSQVFGSLTPKSVLGLSKVLQPQILAVGDYACRQSQNRHETPLGLRFIYTGQIRLVWINSHGQGTTVCKLRQGSMFGAASLLVGGCSFVDAVADQCSEMLILPLEDFVELMLVTKREQPPSPRSPRLKKGSIVQERRGLPRSLSGSAFKMGVVTVDRGSKSRISPKISSRHPTSPLTHLYPDKPIRKDSTGFGSATGDGEGAGVAGAVDSAGGGGDRNVGDAVEGRNFGFNRAVRQDVRSFALEIQRTVQVYGRARRHSLLDQVVKVWREKDGEGPEPSPLGSPQSALRTLRGKSFRTPKAKSPLSSQEPSREPSPVNGAPANSSSGQRLDGSDNTPEREIFLSDSRGSGSNHSDSNRSSGNSHLDSNSQGEKGVSIVYYHVISSM